METAQQQEVRRSAPIPAPQNDWFSFRRRNADIGIGKTGEDGSLEDWQQLLREVGSDRLTTAIIKARATGRKGDRIWFARALEALGGDSSQSDADDMQSDATMTKAAQRARVDLLIWCVCHGGKLYADALFPWTPMPDDEESTAVRTPFGRVKRIPMQDPLTPERRAKIEEMADRARLELLAQCGLKDERRYNGLLSDTVKATPRLVAWLRSQRLLPSRTTKE